MMSFALPYADRPLPTNWPSIRVYHRRWGRQDLSVADLTHIRSMANYSWLCWRDGREMLMPRTMKFYEPFLPEGCFVRLHRNCMVNRKYIARLERTENGGEVHLTTGVVLNVSRRRWQEVQQLLLAQAWYN